MKIHNIFCKDDCECGKKCYAHPDLELKEHLCLDCIKKSDDWDMSPEGINIDNLKWLFYDFPIVILKYIYYRFKGVYR